MLVNKNLFQNTIQIRRIESTLNKKVATRMISSVRTSDEGAIRLSAIILRFGEVRSNSCNSLSGLRERITRNFVSCLQQ